MEFTVTKSVFEPVLSRLLSVVERKTPLPILENLRIEAREQTLYLTATNLEVTLYEEFTHKELAVSEPGVMMVPARKLYEIIKLLKEGPVKLALATNDWAIVVAKGSKFKVPSPPADRFPELPQFNGAMWLDIPATDIKALVAATQFAAATAEDPRFALRSIKIEMNTEGLRMVATNQSRLAIAQVRLDALLPDDLDVLLPDRAASELSKLAAVEGDIGVALSDNALFFKAGQTTLVSRLTAGSFPNYQLLIDYVANRTSMATFNSDELSSAIKRAMLAADEKSYAVRLQFTPTELHITAASSEGGSAEERLACEFKGEGVILNLNGKTITEYLDMVKGRVRVELGDHKQPLLCVTEDERRSFRYIFMPLQQ